MQDLILLRIYRYFRVASKKSLKKHGRTEGIYGFDIAVISTLKREMIMGHVNSVGKERDALIYNNDLSDYDRAPKNENISNAQNSSNTQDSQNTYSRSNPVNTQMTENIQNKTDMHNTKNTSNSSHSIKPQKTENNQNSSKMQNTKNTQDAESLISGAFYNSALPLIKIYRLSTVAVNHLIRGSHTIHEKIALSDGTDGVLLTPGKLTNKFVVLSTDSEPLIFYDGLCRETKLDPCYIPFLSDAPVECLKKKLRNVEITESGCNIYENERNESIIDQCPLMEDQSNNNDVSDHISNKKNVLDEPRPLQTQSKEYIQAKILLKSRIMTYVHGKSPFYRVYLCKEEADTNENIKKGPRGGEVDLEYSNETGNDITKDPKNDDVCTPSKRSTQCTNENSSEPKHQSAHTTTSPYFILTLWNSQVFYDLPLHASILFTPIERNRYTPGHSVINSYADTKCIQREMRALGEIFVVLEKNHAEKRKMNSTEKQRENRLDGQGVNGSKEFKMNGLEQKRGNCPEEQGAFGLKERERKGSKEGGVDSSKEQKTNSSEKEKKASLEEAIDLVQGYSKERGLNISKKQRLNEVEEPNAFQTIPNPLDHTNLPFPHTITGLIISISPMFKSRRNAPHHLLSPVNVKDHVLDFYFVTLLGVVTNGHKTNTKYNKSCSKHGRCINEQITGCGCECKRNQNTANNSIHECSFHYNLTRFNILLFCDSSHLFYELKGGMLVKITNLYKICDFYTNSIFTSVEKGMDEFSELIEAGYISESVEIKDITCLNCISELKYTDVLKEPRSKMPIICTTGTLVLFDINVVSPFKPLLFQHTLIDYTHLDTLTDTLIVSEGRLLLIKGRIVEKREMVTVKCEYVEMEGINENKFSHCNLYNREQHIEACMINTPRNYKYEMETANSSIKENHEIKKGETSKIADFGMEGASLFTSYTKNNDSRPYEYNTETGDSVAIHRQNDNIRNVVYTSENNTVDNNHRKSVSRHHGRKQKIGKKFYQKGNMYKIRNRDDQHLNLVAFREIDEQKEDFQVLMVRMDQDSVILIAF